MHYASVEAGTIRRKKNGLWSIECIIFQDLWLIWNAIKILHFVDWFQKVKSAAIWKCHQKEMSVNWRKNRWKVASLPNKIPLQKYFVKSFKELMNVMRFRNFYNLFLEKFREIKYSKLVHYKLFWRNIYK